MKMLKKLCCVVLTAAVAAAAVGCGGSASTPAAQKMQKLKLVQSGYEIETDGLGDRYVYYGVKLRNPNKLKKASAPVIRVTRYDKKGEVTGTEDWTVGTIWPKQTAYFANMTTAEKDTVNVKISVYAEDYVEIDQEKAKAERNRFKVLNYRVNRGDDPTVVGELKNNGAKVDSVMICAVFYRDGKIVGGSSDFTGRVGKGAVVPYQVNTYGSGIPDYDKVEMFAQNWGAIED